MQIQLKELDKQLEKSFAPLYILSGDVPLLVQETRDRIRKAAQNRGFLKPVVFYVESGFQWQDVRQRVQNFELFSAKELIDIRNPNAKFDADSIDFLTEYLNITPSDH